MLAPSANKLLEKTLQELQIRENEITAVIGCYNANHRNDEIIINTFRDVPFITESGHEALDNFIKTELFTLAEIERQTGVTVDKLQHMIDVCRERGDIPADAYLPAFPLNGELVVHKSYVETMQDRYLTFSDYLDNNPEEVLETDEQDEIHASYDEDEEETPVEDEEPHVDEIVVATSPDIDDSDLQKKLKKEQQKKDKQKRDDIIAKEKERQQRDAENAKKDAARLGFEKKREEDFRREELLKEQNLKKEQERLAHQDKVKGVMGSAYDEKKTETTVSAATFGYSSDEHERIKETIRREQEASLDRANEESARLDRLNKEQQRHEQSKPADTYKAPETPRTFDPYKKSESYKPYEEAKHETRQSERMDGARSDSERHYETSKHEEPKKEEYKPYTPTTSFVKDEYKAPSDGYIAPKKDEYKPTEYRPAPEKPVYNSYQEYVKVEPIREDKKEEFVSRLTPAQLDRIEKTEYKPSFEQPKYEPKPYSPETYEPAYREENQYKEPSRNAYKSSEPRKEEHKDEYRPYTPVSSFKEDHKKQPKYDTPKTPDYHETSKPDYKPNEGYTRQPERTDGARSDSQRYKTPKYDEPKVDARNPYEVKSSGSENKQPDVSKIEPVRDTYKSETYHPGDTYKPHQEERKTEHQETRKEEYRTETRQPERMDGARNDAERHQDALHSDKKDEYKPYNPTTSFTKEDKSPVSDQRGTGTVSSVGGTPIRKEQDKPVSGEYRGSEHTPAYDNSPATKEEHKSFVSGTTIPSVVKDGTHEKTRVISEMPKSFEGKENEIKQEYKPYSPVSSFTEKGEDRPVSTEKGASFVAPVVKNHGIVEKTIPVAPAAFDRKEERYNPVADVKVEKVYYDTIAGRKVAIPESQYQRFTELKDLADNFKPKTAEQVKEIRSFETYTGTKQVGNREEYGIAITMNGRTFISDTATVSDAEKIRTAIATGAVIDEGLKNNISYFKNLDIDTVRVRAEQTKQRNEEMAKGRHDALDDEALHHGGIERYHDKIRDDGRKDARDDLAVHHGGTEKLADKIRDDGRKDAEDDNRAFNIARDKLSETREKTSFDPETGSKVIGDANSLKVELQHTRPKTDDNNKKTETGILLNGQRVKNADNFEIPSNGFVEDAKTGAIFATIGSHTYRMDKADYESFMKIKGRAKDGVVREDDLRELNRFTSLTSRNDLISLIKGGKTFDDVEVSIGSVQNRKSLKDAYGPEVDADKYEAHARFADTAASVLMAPLMANEVGRAIQKATGTVKTVTYLMGVDGHSFKFRHDNYHVKFGKVGDNVYTNAGYSNELLSTIKEKNATATPYQIAHSSLRNTLTHNTAQLNMMLKEEGIEDLLDETFGLTVIKNPKRLNAGGLKSFLEANNIETLTGMKGDEIRVLARNVQNDTVKSRLGMEAKLNDYLAKNKIDLANLSDDDIAMLINSMTDKSLKNLLIERTGIVGFENPLFAQKGKRFMTNGTIIDNKNKALRILAGSETLNVNSVASRYGRLSIRQLQQLLNSGEFANDPLRKQALIVYMQTRMLEEGGLHAFSLRDRFQRVVQSFMQDASSDDAFAGIRETANLAHTTRKLLSVPGNLKSMMKTKIAKHERKIAQRLERRASNTSDLNKADKIYKKAEEKMKNSNRLSERRTTLKERLQEKAKEKTAAATSRLAKTKLGRKVSEIAAKAKGSRFGKLIGAVSKGAKELGAAVQAIFKALAKFMHYIAIAILVIFGIILSIEAILLLIGFGGKVIIGFWDDLFGTEIGSERLLTILEEMQEEDKRLFDWIDDKIELNDLNLSSWETPSAFGFINANGNKNERVQITTGDHVEQLYWSGTTEKNNPVSGTLGVTTIPRYSNAQDILSVNYAAFDGSLSIMENWLNKDSKYCKKLWNNSHMCYVCGNQLVDEGFLGTDDTNFHAHTVNLKPCSTGDATYTYYCDTTNTTKSAVSSHNGTFWVYNANIYANQNINPESSKTSNVYLAIVDGDTNEWGTQGGKLYGREFGNNHSGAGCISFECSSTKKVNQSITFQGQTFTGITYKMPTYSNGSECDNHTSLSYCTSYYCNNKHTVTHSNSKLGSCNNKYRHGSTTSCNNADSTKVPTTWCDYETEIVYAPAIIYINGRGYTFSVPVTRNVCPDDCDNMKQGEEIISVTYNGNTAYLTEAVYHDECEGHDFVTEYACKGHCNGHSICGGHIECEGHYRCDGHTMSYCTGHVTISMQVQQYGVYDTEMYSKEVQETEEDMTKKQKEYAQSVYEQDWETTYGISFSSQDNPYGKMSDGKKAELMIDASTAGIGENPLKIFSLAVDSIGRIPYYGKLSEYYDHIGEPGYNTGYERIDDSDIFFYQFSQIAVTPHGNLADDKGHCYMGLDEKGYVNMMLYQNGFLSSFSPDAFLLTAGWQKITGTSGLQPGDVITYKLANAGEMHYGFYVGMVGSQHQIIAMDKDAGNVIMMTIPLNPSLTTAYRKY